MITARVYGKVLSHVLLHNFPLAIVKWKVINWLSTKFEFRFEFLRLLAYYKNSRIVSKYLTRCTFQFFPFVFSLSLHFQSTRVIRRLMESQWNFMALYQRRLRYSCFYRIDVTMTADEGRTISRTGSYENQSSISYRCNYTGWSSNNYRLILVFMKL